MVRERLSEPLPNGGAGRAAQGLPHDGITGSGPLLSQLQNRAIDSA